MNWLGPAIELEQILMCKLNNTILGSTIYNAVSCTAYRNSVSYGQHTPNPHTAHLHTSATWAPVHTVTILTSLSNISDRQLWNEHLQPLFLVCPGNIDTACKFVVNQTSAILRNQFCFLTGSIGFTSPSIHWFMYICTKILILTILSVI